MGNFIAGKGEVSKSVWVKTYKNGLPKIIGLENKYRFENLLRDLEMGNSPSPLIRALISTLSIFRAMSPKVWIPKFSTVTNPFQGISEVFDSELLHKGLKSLNAVNYFKGRRLKEPVFFLSNKSGVNAKIAYLSMGLDLLALLRNPTIYIGIIRFAFFHRFYHYLIVLILSSLLVLPLLLFPIDLYLGRLGLIKELRGKCRIIGITDN